LKIEIWLNSQGVEKLAEEAASGCRRGQIEDVFVSVTVRPEYLDV